MKNLKIRPGHRSGLKQYGEWDIPLKNRKERGKWLKTKNQGVKDEKNFSSQRNFYSLQKKLFIYGVGFLLGSFLLFYGLLSFLQNHFASTIQEIFQLGLGFNETEAFALYEKLFRSHRDLWIGLLFILIFLSALWLYCHWIVQRFQEVDQALNTFFSSMGMEPSLSEELRPINKKIERLKSQLESQKNELALNQQKKNDLIMYLAHDLKTPLACTISYLTLLKEEKEISSDIQEKYLSIALNKTRRIEEMIEEFLEISKYSLSTLSLMYSTIDLTLLIEQVMFELQPLLKSKQLSYSLDLPLHILLSGDPDKLQRVFDNILRNAILYSDPKTLLEIKGHIKEEKIILSFSNQGPTIPLEKLEHVFEQFYRLDSARSSNGSGLGLAIAKQIVLLHQGEIRAISQEGITTFEIILPLSKEVKNL